MLLPPRITAIKHSAGSKFQRKTTSCSGYRWGAGGVDAKAENGQGTRDAGHGHALSFVAAAAAAQASQTTTTKRMLTYPKEAVGNFWQNKRPRRLNFRS